MEERTTLYMDTFNKFNRYQQELTFLNQKYASFFNQRDEDYDVDYESLDKVHKAMVDEWLKVWKDSDWFKEFQEKLKEFWVEVDREMVRKEWIMEILYPLTEEQIVEVLEFFWIENSNSKKKNDSDEDTLNNVLLEGFLSDINRYKAIKKDIEEMLSNDDTRAIISRIWKLIRKDLLTTLKSDKSLLEAWEAVTFEWKKKFWKRHWKWGKEESGEGFDSKELHEKFTTSVLTFHEIEKLYQKYNYVFTMRDIKDLHVILSALRSGEMILMTWDTWSWKTELSLLIADLYLDEVYTDKSERREKRPIFVTGNSDTDFSDLTVEKIMTSKSAVSDQNDAIFWFDEDKKKRLTSVLDTILKTDEVQKDINDEIDALPDWEERKAKLREDVKKFDFFKLNIFTEYHMQWIVKAMANWVPLILDEINGISPEVLLWLNHYFTRRVGQTISLWNGFDPITIKKWFCILCTWNDKNENSKINRYQWRYNIDESLLNRMYRICKWYHKQTVVDYSNDNRMLGEQQETQLDYMNENELYGVILMLCFNKKWNNKDIDEISNSTLLKKMINTQTVGFDLIKESFRGKSVNESKEEVFKELRNLAKFVHYVQEAYQWHTVLLGGKDAATLNSSPFSMRQLVSIIRDWKSDTKSLWYHLYNVYVRQIPAENDDRYWVYRIAQEVWFISEDNHIENKPEDIQRVTQELEKKNTEEFHTWSHTRNAHIKETKVDDALLESHLIITKQDFYKEYFWRQFWNISDEAFQQQIDEEKKELVEMWKMEIIEDSVEDLKMNVEVSLDAIATYLEDKNNGYCIALDFEPYSCLKYFCEDKDDKWKYKYIEGWEREDKLKEAHDILIRIVEKFQNWDSVTDEGMQELNEAIQELGKLK